MAGVKHRGIDVSVKEGGDLVWWSVSVEDVCKVFMKGLGEI